MKQWLQIIGIGEDGMAGLSPDAQTLVREAEVIVGGQRHHDLTDGVTAERLAWPSPFDAMIDTLKALKGRHVVVLVTGDPLWYSVGARILKAIPADEISFHPQISAFQWAAVRMGWSLADVETLTVHGRRVEQAIPFFAHGARLLVLTQDRTTPAKIADLLRERGFGRSRMTALGALGGANETRVEGIADDWDGDVPDFHTLAIECAASRAPLPRGPGLPDSAFEHDGKMTKSEVRAVTLSRLAPQRGAVLWDIGCGCGSVGIEWLRAVRDAEAVGIDTNQDRLDIARRNADILGAPRLELIRGKVPDALSDLVAPDAVFIGGGLSEAVVATALSSLQPFGRLVANAVTLESEALLIAMQAKHGGELSRIAVSRAEAVGPFRGWKPLMTVTQWSLVT